MVVNNPNNWHWVDKNCIGWARDYFQEKLTGLDTGSAEEGIGGKFARVKTVTSVDGDCEVNQRKGKVISLFDLKLVLSIEGNVGEKKFEGSITIPEVSFDSSPSDYQFVISIYKETSELSEIKPVIRQRLVPQLRDIFQKFGTDLLFSNGADIQVPEEQVKSQFTKANQKTSFESAAKPSVTHSNTTGARKQNMNVGASTSRTTQKNTETITATEGANNTTNIQMEPTFTVPAKDLYFTFLDKSRIMAWSRGSFKVTESSDPQSSILKNGDKFELFDGNTISELVSCEEGKSLRLRWKLRDWSAKNNSVLNIEFHESQEYHETKLDVRWEGIPIGEEDRVRSNFEDYYVRPIKITFGYGIVL